MTPRQRERVKSVACAALVLAAWLVLAGWRWTLALVGLVALIWLVGYQLPLRRLLKRAKEGR